MQAQRHDLIDAVDVYFLRDAPSRVDVAGVEIVDGSDFAILLDYLIGASRSRALVPCFDPNLLLGADHYPEVQIIICPLAATRRTNKKHGIGSKNRVLHLLLVENQLFG